MESIYCNSLEKWVPENGVAAGWATIATICQIFAILKSVFIARVPHYPQRTNQSPVAVIDNYIETGEMSWCRFCRQWWHRESS